MNAENVERSPTKSKSRIPDNSILFEKVVPVTLAGMGIVTVILILFAAGILLGFIQF